MMNKNVANYTDFTEQHYQKKIVQAPGGESHFSIGWSNEKTDYGPSRNSRSLGKQRDTNSQEGAYGRAPTYGNQGQQGSYSPQGGYGQPGSYAPQPGSYAPQQGGYPAPQYPQQPNYQLDPQPIYQLKPSPAQYSGKQEGSYGPPPGQRVPSSTNIYSSQPEELDRMAKQYERKKLETPQQAQTPQQQQQRPPRPPSNPSNTSNPRTEEKACIKIRGAPQSQISFGDNSYNYWKDTNKNLEPRKNTHQEPQGSGSYLPQSRSVDRSNNQQQQFQPEQFKPSVRVHNPPGGKSNFQLG